MTVSQESVRERLAEAMRRAGYAQAGPQFERLLKELAAFPALGSAETERSPVDWMSARKVGRFIYEAPSQSAETVAGLVEALRPFARASRATHADDEQVVFTPVIDANYCITAGDLRRAAEAVAKVTEGKVVD